MSANTGPLLREDSRQSRFWRFVRPSVGLQVVIVLIQAIFAWPAAILTLSLFVAHQAGVWRGMHPPSGWNGARWIE